MVTRLKLAGQSHKLIAATIGVCATTLVRHFERELRFAMAVLNGNVAATIYQKAVAGDAACLIFWCKARMGWREKRSVELTGTAGTLLVPSSIGLEVVNADGVPATSYNQTLAPRLGSFAAPNGVLIKGQRDGGTTSSVG